MKRKLDILHFSVHGLIRGANLELGRDPDTGGQCLYVLELVKALARREEVGRVSLVTRKVFDRNVSADYAQDRELLGGSGDICRIEAGPRRYLRKEVLWRHLDGFVDGTLAWLRREKRVPDLVHAHYADAGYVGRQVAAVLGCPFVFTGHSLGRVKRERLIEGGSVGEDIEKRYNLAARIEAEELSLDAASMVCTSTRQEVEEQYAMYDQYAADRMKVIPPGVDLSRFEGEGHPEVMAAVDAKLSRFLRDPSKPAVLAIARADERKNLVGLVRAFGENAWLREHANLIVVGGNRETLADLPAGGRKVWNALLRLMDDLDLYGVCAVPKKHASQEVAGFYRWAAERKGVFVNPAYTEPFGLTLLEASAAGLPLVATHDGGPRDILANCENGELVDPLDSDAIGRAIEGILANPDRHGELAELGEKRVREHYSWDAHVDRYLKELQKVLPSEPRSWHQGTRQVMAKADRWLVMDLPPNFENEPHELIERWHHLFDPIDDSVRLGLGIATGLSSEDAWAVIERLGMPKPSFVIAGLGASIRYGNARVRDEVWEKQVRHRWKREEVLDALSEFEGLELQPEENQHDLKVSYFRDQAGGPDMARIVSHLRERGVSGKVMMTANAYVDIVPVRSGKDVALRYLEYKWGIDPASIYCYGMYGNDASMVRGRNLAAIAANADEVLRRFRSRPRLVKCRQSGLAGLFEGLDHYGVLAGEPPPLPGQGATSDDEAVPEIELLT
ncbi:sucrose-phosphate synthase [Haloferula luteola]|uniref:sucrose-phosphate synthase n=1 Tax=Haloferula luteola TaxID=595692 RepID=A0A840VDE3_9BACT|nr:HAD family hydrolase [Haloferula luteola]MBB5351839.1 sucrose-phosphate synthase [Haloferula luteola]